MAFRFDPRARLMFLFVGCLFVAPLGAQAPPGVNVGARIRVSTADIRKGIGVVEAVTSDTLVFRPDDATTSVTIPIAALRRLEISRGASARKSSAWRGAKWGAAIGAGAGAISLGLQHEEVGGGSSVGEAAALGVWSGGLFGGAIGALVGAARATEQWERVR